MNYFLDPIALAEAENCTFAGQRIGDLSRDELVKIIFWMGRDGERIRKQAIQDAEMFSLIAKL